MKSPSTLLQRFLFVLALVAMAPNAFAKEWYETVAFKVDDPFQFDSHREILFPKSGLRLGGRIGTGFVYAILPQSTVKQMERSTDHLIVVDKHVLTSSEAAAYKAFFKKRDNRGQIPWIVGAVGSIPGKLTGAVGIATTLLDVASRLNPSHTVSPSAMEGLISEGGTFSLVFILREEGSDRRFVGTSVVYEVSVGRERRSYVISSGTFALKIQ